MAYEGHIAGLGDRPPGKRLQGRVIQWMQSRSAEEIRGRRAAVVAAVSELAELEFVNGGGTGSLHGTAGEDAVTELAAGSGFFAPTLFDTYSAFKLRPAAMFAMPVVRKPSASIATVLGGGYLASGLGEPSRVPSPYLPAGLRLDRFEGAGEVQTPVLGDAAAPPARRRSRVLPAHQGGRAVRAVRFPPPGVGRPRRRRGPDLPGRGPHLPVAGFRPAGARPRGRGSAARSAAAPCWWTRSRTAAGGRTRSGAGSSARTRLRRSWPAT